MTPYRSNRPHRSPGEADVLESEPRTVCNLRNLVTTEVEEDICGFCGEPGADKIPHPVRWPGEESAGTELVHAACEDAECGRAHAALSDKERKQFLQTL